MEHAKSGSEDAHRLIAAASNIRLKAMSDDELFDDDIESDVRGGSTHSLSSLSVSSVPYGTFDESEGSLTSSIYSFN